MQNSKTKGKKERFDVLCEYQKCQQWEEWQAWSQESQWHRSPDQQAFRHDRNHLLGLGLEGLSSTQGLTFFLFVWITKWANTELSLSLFIGETKGLTCSNVGKVDTFQQHLGILFWSDYTLVHMYVHHLRRHGRLLPTSLIFCSLSIFIRSLRCSSCNMILHVWHVQEPVSSELDIIYKIKFHYHLMWIILDSFAV